GALDRQLLRRADRGDGAAVRGLARGEAHDRKGDQELRLRDGAGDATGRGGHDVELDDQPQRPEHGRLRAQIPGEETMRWFALRTVGGLIIAVAALLAVSLALAGAAFAGEPAPWGKAENLGERMTLEKTGVCTDGKSHYVIVAPSEEQSTPLYYGDGKTLYRVPLPPWVLSGDSFFEPRFFAKTKNSNFRG